MSESVSTTNSSNQPILSITVPSYNVEQYLEKGLASFLDDRFAGKLEVIIVNDGSTDQTQEIAQKYVSQHPGIFHLVNKANGGHGSTINTGIAYASGKYFRIVDGDDWVNTENLVTLIGLLEEIDSDIVVDEKREVDMQTGDSQLLKFPLYIKPLTEQSFEEACSVENTESYISIHTLTTKTELLRDKGIHILEGIFYVDYEYVVKTTCYAKTVTFIPLEIYQYLVGNSAQSVAAQNYVNRYEQHEKIVRELLDFYTRCSFDEAISQYLFAKIRLLINTHYNILLIFDTDRPRGRKRASEFSIWLKKHYPAFAQSTETRYRQARIMGRLGVDKNKLDCFMGRR